MFEGEGKISPSISIKNKRVSIYQFPTVSFFLFPRQVKLAWPESTTKILFFPPCRFPFLSFSLFFSSRDRTCGTPCSVSRFNCNHGPVFCSTFINWGNRGPELRRGEEDNKRIGATRAAKPLRGYGTFLFALVCVMSFFFLSFFSFTYSCRYHGIEKSIAVYIAERMSIVIPFLFD